jgi:hypothetical protein
LQANGGHAKNIRANLPPYGALAAAAEGKPTRFRDLADQYVALDENTRCKPDEDAVGIYTKLLGRQSDLTQRLRAASYL